MKKIFLSILALILVFAGCSSSVSVSSDYDPATDFSNYKTFAVSQQISQGSALEKAPLIKDRVIKATESEMRQKGYVNAWPDKADLIIYPIAGTKDKINVTDWGYSYGTGYWGANPYGRNIDVTSYTEASLILDLVDNKTHQLVWRGIGTGIIHQNRNPEERSRAVDEAVDNILAQFPPKK